MQILHGRLRGVAIAGTLFLTLSCQGAPTSRASSSGSQESSSVAARVGDTEITLAQVDEKALQTNMSAYQELYNARREALEELVAEALLEQEARSRGITRDALVAEEIESKIPEVTAQDVEEFFNQNRARIGQQTLEQIGPQIREYLEARNDATARQEFLTRLRGKADVSVSLDPPRVPVQVARDERLKGPADAVVTIVEYSDFQWPFCARVGPTLQQIEKTYGDDVRFVYRDFALPNHPEAAPAAEAALCAHDQGKFWPYHDRLFENQRSLSRENYSKFAADVGLDVNAFNECFESGRFRERVQRDYQEGSSLGVNATPSFFINGRFLSGAQPFDAFKAILDEEIGR